MQRSNIEQVLTLNCPADIIKLLLDSYVRALGEYRKGNWQYCINEMGQFIEASIRIIEASITGKIISLQTKLPIFDNQLLIKWENVTGKDESMRIIIPRVLYSMTCIRNKRGAIHTSSINPNKMDARLLIDNAKWILAELFRLNSNKTPQETADIVDSIINKEIPLIWQCGSIKRILDSSMPVRDQILCLLYSENNKTDKELLSYTEYANGTRFKTILAKLHKDRLIEYSQTTCIITPKGLVEAEKLLK